MPIDIAAALYAALYSGRCILDVGANVGLHSLAWARLAPVVALEPAPGTYARLEANVAANGLGDRIRTLRTAAGHAVGEVEFFVAADSAFSSLKDTGRKRIRERVRVPCTTLDALAAELPLPVGLLKIDVEGLERAVIAGAAQLLLRDRPVLLVEIYGGAASNPDPEGTVEEIRTRGYEPFIYAQDAGLLPYEKHRDDRTTTSSCPGRPSEGKTWPRWPPSSTLGPGQPSNGIHQQSASISYWHKPITTSVATTARFRPARNCLISVVAPCTVFHVIAVRLGDLFLKFIPAPILVKTLLFVRYAPRDLLDKLTGHTDPLIPPRRKALFTGGPPERPGARGAFRESGDEFFAYLRDYGQIAPHHRILDIGSGVGRNARPLTAFLDPAKGRYDGFDIDASGVRWCSHHYASHPNFHFQRANIYNKFYNPRGTVQAQEFTFPYPDASFDFAFASSVFTHIPLPAVAHYLKETARVLPPGARALLTVFLWNPESQASVGQGKSSLPFRPYGDVIAIDPVVPEAAIALPQEGWDQAVRDAGLEQVGDVLWGNWCGRTPFTSYQDIVIVRRLG